MISILNIKTNFFSILILGYCVYVMVYYKSIQLRYIRLIALAFILEVGKFQGYFLAIGKSEVSYEDAFVTILLVINCVSMAKHKRYDKKNIHCCNGSSDCGSFGNHYGAYCAISRVNYSI